MKSMKLVLYAVVLSFIVSNPLLAYSGNLQVSEIENLGETTFSLQECSSVDWRREKIVSTEVVGDISLGGSSQGVDVYVTFKDHQTENIKQTVNVPLIKNIAQYFDGENSTIYTIYDYSNHLFIDIIPCSEGMIFIYVAMDVNDMQFSGKAIVEERVFDAMNWKSVRNYAQFGEIGIIPEEETDDRYDIPQTSVLPICSLMESKYADTTIISNNKFLAASNPTSTDFFIAHIREDSITEPSRNAEWVEVYSWCDAHIIRRAPTKAQMLSDYQYYTFHSTSYERNIGGYQAHFHGAEWAWPVEGWLISPPLGFLFAAEVENCWVATEEGISLPVDTIIYAQVCYGLTKQEFAKAWCDYGARSYIGSEGNHASWYGKDWDFWSICMARSDCDVESTVNFINGKYTPGDLSYYPSDMGEWVLLNDDSGTPTFPDDWNYRKRHYVSGRAGAGTNYQLQITVRYGQGSSGGNTVYLNGKCQIDFDDIRFTDNDKVTLLDYWCQEYEMGDYAIFWVEVKDNLDSGRNIYIYYGDNRPDAASSTSNGEDTFLFFDDFENGDLDRWTSSSTWTVQSSTAKCGTYAAYGAVGTGALIYSPEGGWTNDVAYHFWARSHDNYKTYVLRVSTDTGTGYDVVAKGADVQYYDGSYHDYGDGAGSDYWGIDTWYELEYRIDLIGSSNSHAELLKDNAKLYSQPKIPTYGGGQGDGTNITGIRHQPHLHYVDNDLFIDNAFVRKWAGLEPNQGLWDTEECVMGGWSYRKSHRINSATGAGNDYQIRIVVHAYAGTDNGENVYVENKAQYDFGDIRFVGDDDESLNYWLERVEQYSIYRWATIWVKVQQSLSYTQDIYIYYGNAFAPSESSGHNTFILFDDFDNRAIDTAWTTNMPAGSISENEEHLTLSINSYENGDWWSGSVEYAPIIYRPSPTGTWAAVVKMNSYSVSDYTHAGIMAYNNRDNAYLWGRYRGGIGVNNFKQEKIISNAGYHGVQYVSTSLPIYLQLRDLGTTLKIDISVSGNIFTNVLSTSDLNPNNIGLFVKEWGTNAISVSFDYFYTRKCVSNEPTHGSWGTEETSW